MSQSKKASTYVALLRGVNVGGKNKLPMAYLAKMFVDLGCDDVRTYIQSGNVVFRATEAKAKKLPGQIAGHLGLVFNYRVPVVVRSAAEMAVVIENNPFLKAGAFEETLHVLFLSTRPEAQQIAALDPDRSPPDRFVVRDREIYLELPNGVADSKLTNAYFDSKLATMCTGRNWRTVMKLYEMMQG
jgi:uncharacterized protein (DUF1697 family)